MRSSPAALKTSTRPLAAPPSLSDVFKEASNSHSDFFVRSLVAIRAELRVALAGVQAIGLRHRDESDVVVARGRNWINGRDCGAHIS